jgi:xanthine dehydrogenase YagS FAD-binding subunit
MKNFTYYRPKSLIEAVGLLDSKWGSTELLAGGTDLLDLQKEYVVQPDKVISLNGIGELGGIKLTKDDVYEIGAGTKLADIATHQWMKEKYPALAEAASLIGGPQIRNMGTLGGNLCQRNRCWYFRDEHVPCLLKGGDKCFALTGDNRYHAIFIQGRKCVMVNPSTLGPVLLALPGTTLHVLGPKSDRTIKISDFFHAPSSKDEREHVLAPNEILLSVHLKAIQGLKNASYEVRHKQAYDWPLVQAAVSFQLEDGKAKGARVVLGHVAATPHVSDVAAKAIEGKEVNETTAAEAGEAAATEAATESTKPLSQTGYKVKLVAVAVKRALLTAAGAKKYWEV